MPMFKGLLSLVMVSAYFMFGVGFNTAHAQQVVYQGNPVTAGDSFDAGVNAAGASASHDTWLNPQWQDNQGQYTGTTAMPFVFYGLERSAYIAEKGLFPVGIPSRLTFVPVEQVGVDYGPLTYFSSLSGQAVNFNPDSQASGGPNIYGGYHPGVEYGITFKFNQPVFAFGLEYQVEAHNASPEPARPSFYFSLDEGPAILVAGPVIPDSNDIASFVGILDAEHPFSTITFYTDGPRDDQGALINFYNAYAGGTIRYASLSSVSAVPESDIAAMMLCGLAFIAGIRRLKTRVPTSRLVV